jgi:hypothetical protein
LTLLDLTLYTNRNFFISEHVALFPYAAEIETDLSFDMGDTIVVCQTLDNGWWYGCDGDQFGWFPGSYVEVCMYLWHSSSISFQ